MSRWARVRWWASDDQATTPTVGDWYATESGNIIARTRRGRKHLATVTRIGNRHAAADACLMAAARRLYEAAQLAESLIEERNAHHARACAALRTALRSAEVEK